MRRIVFASSVSFLLTVASCTPGGGGSSRGSTGASTRGSSGGSSSNASGSTGSTASGNGGGNSGGSSAQGTSGGGAGSTGSATNGGSSAGGSCTEADDEPCQLTNGYGFCCSGICTDPQADPQNCGQCYNFCQLSQTCSQGSCAYANCDGVQNGSLCAGNAGSQDPSEQCVGGVCVATSCGGASGLAECALSGDAGVGSCCEGQCSGLADPANCGGCGVQCPTGASCSDGSCSSSCLDAGCPSGTFCSQSQYSGSVCLSPSCTGLPDEQACSAGGGAGGNCCNQSCIDTLSDPQNCGQCGNLCPSGTLCLYGTCETTAANCATAAVGSLCQQADGGVGSCCGSCGQLDYQADPSNCGACGEICSQGATCVAGQCVLADGGYGQCDEPGNVCPAADACVDGFCATESCNATNAMESCVGTSGRGACCGSVCVDTDDDSANCGLCGTVCPTGMFCTGAECVAVQACGPSNSGDACPLASNQAGVCCSGQCVDTTTDNDNCESCGVACPLGEVCAQGVYPPCSLPDGGSGPTCYDGAAACPTGTICSDGECLAASCAPGSTGVRCAFGASAVGTCCDGVCTDTTQDPANCGACGTTCASGVCYTSIGVAQCLPSSSGDCSTANGGFGCAPGTTCLGGSCVSSSGCNGPFGFCQASDGNVGACCQNFFGTMCTDLATDVQNCGNCGAQCPTGQTCANGLCSGSVSPCEAGRREAYCDLDAGTSQVCCPGGGCTDIESDPSNCAQCGYACQAGLSCLAGQCLATTCTSVTAGQACEEGDGGQGACCASSCLDVSADPNNCGACGVKCANVESCQWGACVIAQCSPAYQGAPCDVDAGGGYFYVGGCCGNGCVDTSSDPANCGLCGNSCGDGGCVGGSCQ